MSGLVGYESSDDDEIEAEEQQHVESKGPTVPRSKAIHDRVPISQGQYATEEDSVSTATESKLTEPTPQGPMAGPSMAPKEDLGLQSEENDFESSQNIIMNLTLPPVPNFDIPESPPGSPDPAVVAKLEQFTQLKKKGVHFNEKLASSTAIKNPNLFNKLCDSFGISEMEQYSTTLPASIWDPTAFPNWAYKEGLAKAQAEANQQRGQARSNAKLSENFVAASGSERKAPRKG